MSLRAVIVDDEKPARDRLRRMLGDHADVVVIGEAADGRSAIELIDRERPDLCLLDVQMPEGDGFEVLRRVRHLPRVIFTTAYDQYAVRAFEVNSLDYLLKPFDRSRLAAALDRARQAIQRPEAVPPGDFLKVLEEIRAGLARVAAAPPASPPGPAAPAAGEAARSPRIAARHKSGVILVDPAEVFWFEAEETVVFVRTVSGRFLVDRTLADLEADLGAAFFRVHRRYLVNLAQVAEILPGGGGHDRVVMRDPGKSALPLSRRQARLLRERLRL